MPALTRPTLRPAPPKPISTASSATTFAPASARCSAVDRPVYPQPIIATSARASPLSGDVGGAGGAVISQRPCESGSFFMAADDSGDFSLMRTATTAAALNHPDPAFASTF